jgi:hypothetical protein
MPARDRIVDVERRDELEQDLRRLLGTRRLVGRPHQPQPLFERLDGARAQREPESRGSLIREDERQAEERSEWKEPARKGVQHRDDDGSGETDA